MPEAIEPVVSANFEKLKGKLRELFELDKADLDFGIYRIMNHKRTIIEEFIDKEMLDKLENEAHLRSADHAVYCFALNWTRTASASRHCGGGNFIIYDAQ